MSNHFYPCKTDDKDKDYSAADVYTGFLKEILRPTVVPMGSARGSCPGGVVLVLASPCMGKTHLLEGEQPAIWGADRFIADSGSDACLHACLRDLLALGRGAVYFSATFLNSDGSAEMVPLTDALIDLPPQLIACTPSSSFRPLGTVGDLVAALEAVRELAERNNLPGGAAPCIVFTLAHCGGSNFAQDVATYCFVEIGWSTAHDCR
jgi:hypothetical protein